MSRGKSSISSRVPVTSGFSIKSTMMNENGNAERQSQSILYENKGKRDATNDISYDLSDKPYLANGRKHIGQNVGQITTFYHNARVCEKCYHLYRELDYLRERYRKLRLRLKKKIKQQEEDPESRRQRDRQIEKKIFEQRKFVSRLSKLKPIVQVSIAGDIQWFSLL